MKNVVVVSYMYLDKCRKLVNQYISPFSMLHK